jgi:hypothetical protein
MDLSRVGGSQGLGNSNLLAKIGATLFVPPFPLHSWLQPPNIFLHSLNQRWIWISMAYNVFAERLPLTAMRPLKMIFLVFVAAAIDSTPETSALSELNKMDEMPK